MEREDRETGREHVQMESKAREIDRGEEHRKEHIVQARPRWVYLVCGKRQWTVRDERVVRE